MSGNDTHSESWKSCPSGELERLVRERKARLRQRITLRYGSALAAVLLIALAGSVIWQKTFAPSGHHYGGIACVEVKAHLAQFIAGNVDTDLAIRIKTHLKDCPNCGPSYRSMQSAHRHNAIIGHASGARCRCRLCRVVGSQIAQLSRDR